MSRNKISRDRRGGIEGLPLQLMIMILVATLGTAIIIGWMGNIETPNSISSVELGSSSVTLTNTSGSDYTTSQPIKVRVFDQNNDPLQGATVILTGYGIMDGDSTVFGETDKDGSVEFDSGLTLRMDGKIGYITVKVSKPGYGEDSSCKIAAIAS